MTKNFKLDRSSTGLLIIDVQERLFPVIDRANEMMHFIRMAVEGFHILNLPIVVTEQNPTGFGQTVGTLKAWLGDNQEYIEKTSFSCMGDDLFKEKISAMKINQWVVIGIEAHICILQTVKDLITEGKEVVVLNDAISSRSIYNFSTAIAELRDCGARISSVETVLFELVKNSKASEFKQISQLVK